MEQGRGGGGGLITNELLDPPPVSTMGGRETCYHGDHLEQLC